MKNGFLKTITCFWMLCSILFLASCSNDRNEEDKNVISGPPVITFDNGTGIYTVKVLKSITITPTVTNVVNPVYTWKDDNGKIIGNEASYTFSPKASGEVFIKFQVNAQNGRIEEELRVDVVDKMPPSVSLIPLYPTYVGNKISIEPSINFKEGATYQWTQNGEKVSTEEIYTFEAKEEGRFNIKLTVTNEDGYGNATSIILVAAKPELSIQFLNNRLTVPQGRTACVAPMVLNSTKSTTYVWEVDGVKQPEAIDSTFTFTPSKPGEYQVKVIAKEGEIIKEAMQTVVCLQSDETKYYRAPAGNSSDRKIKVYGLMPAPGQFIGQLSGSTEIEASASAEKHLNSGGINNDHYISLGAWGGYIVFGLDHSIYNLSATDNNKYDFTIIGNAFDGSSEPGIVYVMQDENGNGLADDTWYELRGSETGKPDTYQNYSVTYYRPVTSNMPLQWIDNRGNSGSITLNPTFPAWIKADSYTLNGTRLKQNSNISGGIWRNEAYDWGYADNFGNDLLSKGDNHDANAVGNGFKIKNAMYPNGKPVNLRYIDFIKIQTGVQSIAGVIGEVSTEVFGLVDLHMNEAPHILE